MNEKSVFNLKPNIAAILSYLFGPFSGMFFLILERNNKFVRFHALQSTLLFSALIIVGWLSSVFIWFSVPILSTLFAVILVILHYIGVIFAWIGKIFLMIKAFRGESYKIPIIGDVAWKQVSKGEIDTVTKES